MKTVSFQEIKHEIISNMRRNMLIPIIGSGFTCNCKSFRGVVPSGYDYREYMIDTILQILELPTREQENLKKDTFSNISSIYHRVVSKDLQEEYLSNNFTRVSIEEHKQRFLSLSWPYIYTLNIDDGIENGSDYSYVIYANRRFNEKVFDDKKCVIKLHGDVSDMLTYRDSTSEIFTQEQYVASLKENEPLLSKLEHDGRYLNILFIGCSLDDEIDILSSFLPSESGDTQTAKYICLVEKPSVLDTIKYEKYGITHCILFDSYDEIYNQLYLAGIEAQKIAEDDLEDYRSFSFKQLSSGYEDNKPYLLFGKSLIDKNHIVTFPYFFISREVSTTIINNLSSYNLQLLVGGRCSGKTYVLADVARKIRDRDVFFFETKDRLSDVAFERLLQRENCIVLADNTALSNEQFEILLSNLDLLKKNNISVVIVVNKNNRDLNSILKLYEMRGKIDPCTVPQIGVSSTLTLPELSEINPLLTAVDAGIFSGKKTIVDNIIGISESLSEKNKYYHVAPKLRTLHELAALIALGIERKIYSDRAVKLDLSESLVTQHRATEPLIDCESTWSFERSFGDSSPVKYVINGEYWLFTQLEAFAQVKSNHKMIVDAYRHIITKIITQEGQPDLLYGNNKASYKEYIFFDNINRLFSFRKSFGRSGLALIQVIYEGLNDLLSADPNYMHQRSKCYIKSSYYESAIPQKHAFLDKAYRDANVALQVFTHRHEECGNDKLLISIDHIKYTQALILCHKCYIDSYSNIDTNTLAVQTLYQALTSPYNSYDYAKKDTFNYSNVIGEMVTNAIAHKNLG